MIIAIAVGLAFFAIGIGILIYGLAALFKRKQQNATSLPATGVVTAFATEMGNKGFLYYPQVQFQIASGQTIWFQSAVGTSGPRYEVGQPVKVLYSAHNPQEAEIDSVTSMWLLPGCMVGMGFLFVIVGGFLSIVMILVAINQP